MVGVVGDGWCWWWVLLLVGGVCCLMKCWLEGTRKCRTREEISELLGITLRYEFWIHSYNLILLQLLWWWW